MENEESSQKEASDNKVPPKRIIKKLNYEDRKNSASDLVSRLKTRKVLGVGEIRDDGGDIYRSKISQILGPSEHLYVKIPKVLHYWQTANVVMFFGSGFFFLLFPKYAGLLDIIKFQTSDSIYVLRLYGSVLVGYAWLYRSLMQTRDRTNIGICLKSSALVYTLHIFANLFHICTNYDTVSFTKCGIIFFVVRLMTAAGSTMILQLVDSSSYVCRWLRRCHSYQNGDWIGDRSPSPRHGSRENIMDTVVDNNITKED